MEPAQRDPNHVPVALGYNYIAKKPSEALVDPVLGYVLMEIQPFDDYVSIPPVGNAERDENHVHAGLVELNDGSGTLQNLSANKVTGLPWVQLT